MEKTQFVVTEICEFGKTGGTKRFFQDFLDYYESKAKNRIEDEENVTASSWFSLRL